MTALASHLLSSGGIVLVLVVTAVWMWRRPGSSRARRLLLAAAIVYASLGSYAISHATSRLLVGGLRPMAAADVPAGPTAIVVLGSGTYTARDWNDDRLPVLDRASAGRVLETIRVFKMTDAAWIIASGGLLRPTPFEEPNGRTMRDMLVRAGVPETRLLLETDSRNTHDEAVIVGRMLGTLNVQHVILVTSETHMRRSLGTFRAQGVRAVPAIAREPPPLMPGMAWVIPSEHGLNRAAARVARDPRPGLLLYSRLVSLTVLWHLVLLKPRADLPAAERRRFADAFRRAVTAIPSVRGVRFGRRAIHGAGYELSAPDAAAFVAIVEFEDLAGLHAYLAHPAHDELGALFGQSLSAAVVCDFEMLADGAADLFEALEPLVDET